MPTLRWRRSVSVLPQNAFASREDDWTLIDETGRPLARIYDSRYPDLEGTWRWRVYVDAAGREAVYASSCATGTEARQKWEALVPDWMGGSRKTRLTP